MPYKINNQDVNIWSKEYEGEPFHALLCDAPYHLTTTVKRFANTKLSDNTQTSERIRNRADGFARLAGSGFMGMNWDGGDVAFRPETWEGLGKHLYPGAFGMTFGGSRTAHRIACAIEDAGFIIHPMIGWVYSQGFPKATAIANQVERWYYGRDEQRTETKSQHCLRCMSEANISQTLNSQEAIGEALQSGLSKQGLPPATSSTDKNAQISKGERKSCLEGGTYLQKTQGELSGGSIHKMPRGISSNGKSRWLYNGTSSSYGEVLEEITNQNGSGTSHRPQSIKQFTDELNALCEQHRTQAIRELSETWLGHRYGLQALKPAMEPIIVFQKPYDPEVGNSVTNITKTGAGALNIDAGRIAVPEPIKTGSGKGQKGQVLDWSKTERNGEDWEGSSLGRWPANFVIDDTASSVLDAQSGHLKSGKMTPEISKRSTSGSPNGIYGKFDINSPLTETYGDSGGASRFFFNVETALDEADPFIYEKKASQKERKAGMGEDVNTHPTLKSISLTTYLSKLLLPPVEYADRRLLVPFSGVASEMIGGLLAGWEYVEGIELTPEYIPIAHKRLEHWVK